MEKELEPEVIEKIMNRAIEINAQCGEECRDFRIMVSPMKEDTLILRWTTIDIGDIDRPKQSYCYECFELDGTSMNCSVNYTDQDEANFFFWSLVALHKQEYCNDHKM